MLLNRTKQSKYWSFAVSIIVDRDYRKFELIFVWSEHA